MENSTFICLRARLVFFWLVRAMVQLHITHSLNIATILAKCDKRYPGIANLYGKLSESAHPNFEGLVTGYSKVNYDEYETRFSNRWMELYGEKTLNLIENFTFTFHHEYDEVWTALMEKLEGWIVANDVRLEATKNTVLQD